MIVEPSLYGNLPRRSRVPASPAATVFAELTSGPGVGLHYTIPEVELRPLSIYNSFCEAGVPGDRVSDDARCGLRRVCVAIFERGKRAKDTMKE